MKKFAKICLILTGCFVLLGLVFCITGTAMGARLENVSIWYDSQQEKFVTAGDEEVALDFEESFSGIRKLNVEIGRANMTIKEGEGSKFTVKAVRPGANFRCVQNGDELEIVEKEKTRIFGITFGSLGKETAIFLEVPKGTVFEKMDLEVGVGYLDAVGIRTKKLEGSCGVGNLDFQGRIDGDCDLECGVGDMSLSLEGKVTDFNYTVECGVGEVYLGNGSFSGLGHSRKMDNGAAKSMKVECGVGSIDIQFPDETSEDSGKTTESTSETSKTEQNDTESLEELRKMQEEYERKAKEYEEKAKEYEERQQERLTP